MKHYTTTKRFCPHQISTKIGAVNLYRRTHDIDFVCRRYHISKASLMRWNKIYDGTRDSLVPRSHKPHSPHPNAHTEEELKWIKDYHRRNPNISICELYGKLREDKGCARNPGSLYRVFVRLGFMKKPESTKKNSKHNKHYDTPIVLGIIHITIRPRMPWHSDKVEQSHRNDQERFYNCLKFYSYNDLLKQMKAYLYRSNRILMAVLGWKTPIQKRAELGG